MRWLFWQSFILIRQKLWIFYLESISSTVRFFYPVFMYHYLLFFFFLKKTYYYCKCYTYEFFIFSRIETTCPFNYSMSQNFEKQLPHSFGFFFSCTDSMCLFNLHLWIKSLSQIHTNKAFSFHGRQKIKYFILAFEEKLAWQIPHPCNFWEI